jgi:hypothetical protein
MKKKLTNRPVEQTITAIHALDLEHIKLRVMDPELGEGWTREHAESVERGYKDYLTLLVKHPEDLEDIVVSKDVDEFWHTHILHTMKYTEDCEKVFGTYLHHNPHIGERTRADIEKTRCLYQQNAAMKAGSAAFCGAAVKAERAAFCGAAVEAGSAAFCGAAIGTEGAAFCGAAVEAGNAAFCGAAIGTEGAAFCGAAIQAGSAAFCGAAVKAERAAFCGAAVEAGSAAFCGAAIGTEGAAFCGAAIQAGSAAFCGAAVRAGNTTDGRFVEVV